LECLQDHKPARTILGKYGVLREEDIIKPLGFLNQQQAMAQVLNWITW